VDGELPDWLLVGELTTLLSKLSMRRMMLLEVTWLIDCRKKRTDISTIMVVKEEDVVNIMGGMENTGGIKLNDHKRKLKNR
jgi:hypothetical protein